MKATRIKFQNRSYILIGTKGGAIATERQFRAGSLAFAYLASDGNVWKDGAIIGRREDIEFQEAFTPSPMFVTPNLN